MKELTAPMKKHQAMTTAQLEAELAEEERYLKSWQKAYADIRAKGGRSTCHSSNIAGHQKRIQSINLALADR